MIICGFPGTGKSTMARRSNWVDLESTPFKERNAWMLYAEVAKHMSDNGYNVMVSTHKELLVELERLETQYTVIVPPKSDKDAYLERYRIRGNTELFIDTLNASWEHWLSEIYTATTFKTVVTLPSGGCIQAWSRGW